MGNKQELLVAVRQPDGVEGTTEVTMITDVAADVVLHWGVKKGQSGEWLLPAKDLWPQGSQVQSPAIPSIGNHQQHVGQTVTCEGRDPAEFQLSFVGCSHHIHASVG